jgi:phosphatidylethanolamine-binding protein (PEBP) family uncharacterized protein
MLQLLNDFAERGWFGPCAAQGTTPHRYVFTVYALDAESLPAAAGSDPSITYKLIRRHTISAATLTAIYPKWARTGDPVIASAT